MKPGESYKYKPTNSIITLVRITDKQAGKKLPEKLYDWTEEDGRQFTNREQDINRWIKFKQIESIEDLGL